MINISSSEAKCQKHMQSHEQTGGGGEAALSARCRGDHLGGHGLGCCGQATRNQDDGDGGVVGDGDGVFGRPGLEGTAPCSLPVVAAPPSIFASASWQAR